MKPLTRLENFLAKIAGDPDAKMDMKPKTRKEMYLDAIARGGGSSGGGSVEPLIVEIGTVDGQEGTFMKAQAKSIYDAFSAGTPVHLVSPFDTGAAVYNLLDGATPNNTLYVFHHLLIGEGRVRNQAFVSSTPTDFPKLNGDAPIG